MFKKHLVLSLYFLLCAGFCVAETSVSKDLGSKSLRRDKTARGSLAPSSIDTLHNENGVAVQHFFIKSQLQARSGRFFISPMISYSVKPDAGKVDTVWVGPAINYEF